MRLRIAAQLAEAAIVANTFDTIRADTLLHALSAFADPGPDPRTVRDERIARLWASGMIADEIGRRVGMSGNSVRVAAWRLSLPTRIGKSQRRSAPVVASPVEPIRRADTPSAMALAGDRRAYSPLQRRRRPFSIKRSA